MTSDTQVYCRICLLTIKSRKSYYNDHCNKTAHKNRIESLGLTGDPGPFDGQTYCPTCNCLIFFSDWDKHLESPDHRLCLEAAVLRETRTKENQKPKSQAPPQSCSTHKKHIKPISTVRFVQELRDSVTPVESTSSTVKKRKKRKAKQVKEESSDNDDASFVADHEEGPVPKRLRRSNRVQVKSEKAIDSAPVSLRPPQSRGPNASTASISAFSVRAVAGAIISSSDDEGTEFMRLFNKLIPHIPRIADLSPDLDRILHAGRMQLRKQGGKKIILSEHEQEGLRILFEFIPGFSEHIQGLTPKKVNELAELAQKATFATCTADATQARIILSSLLEKDANSVAVGRGFSDRTYGKLLCPIFFDWSKAKIREGLRSGDLQVRGDQYTLSMYRDCKCDEDDLEEGLLQNEILVSVFKAVFTDKSSNTKASSLTNAQRIGLLEVTPRSIAYAACMMRFAASDKENWSVVDGGFDYRHYYSAIVDIFDDGESAAALLTWWNHRVFGKAGRKSFAKSTLDLLKEQRESKRTRNS